MIKSIANYEISKTGIEAAMLKELEVDNLTQALFFPKFFEVETINACNAKCIMCTIHDWKIEAHI